MIHSAARLPRCGCPWPHEAQLASYLLQGTHLHFYLPLGVCAVFFFCALPPLASFATVWHKRKQLTQPHVKQVIGFLYDRYR
jgi:hypothetical protein